jgi:peptide/nickel transport system permease protein
MTNYIIRRILQAIPLVLLISVVLFFMMQLSGDPLATLGGRQPPRAADRERLARRLGLDKPVYLQYLYWLAGNDWVAVDEDEEGNPIYGTRKGVIRGDFGTSFVTRQPVTEIIGDRLPNTLILMLTSYVLIVSVSLVVGIISAIRQYSTLDNVLTTASFITFSVPIFLMAYILSYIFAVKFRQWGLPYFPASGMFNPIIGRTFSQVTWHLVLPVLSISLLSIAGYSRFIRSTMLEVIHSDYIRTARSKGLQENRILFIHAFKNAALPLVTLVGIDLPLLIGGAVVTETIFAWPGMGRLFIDHLTRSDYPVLMGLLVMISLAVVVFQLLTDVVYTMIDPRIRFN